MNGPIRQVGPRGVVAVTGSEAAAYLQGQVSQDIDAIPDGGAAWSLVLDPTGKLVAWFRIWRVGDGFRLDVEPGAMAALVAREGFEFLVSPIRRLGALDVPVPFSPKLENHVVPNEEKIVAEVLSMVAE